MTRTQFTDARRNVRRQIVSWISIVVIGLVSLIAYLSLIYSSEAIKGTVSDYYNTYAFWDLQIISTYLLDADDLSAIRAVKGVDRAEGVLTLEAKLLDTGTDTSVTVQALPEKISLPELLSGRLPEAAGECAVEQQLQKTLGISAGDRLRVANVSVAGIEPLKVTEYIVTGIFRHPDHISFELPEAPYVLVTQDSFNLEGLNNSFMEIRVRIADAPENRYSKDYRKAVEPVHDAIDAVMTKQTAVKEEKLRADSADQVRAGQEKLDEAAVKLDEAEQQLNDAAKQLDEGKEKLASAREELDKGWTELKAAEEQLNAARQKLDDGSHALADAEYQIASLEGLMYKASALIDSIDGMTGGSPGDYLPGGVSNEIQTAKEGLQQYSKGRELWYYSGEEYLDGLTKFEQGKKTLEQGEREYHEGKAEYEKGLAEYEKGKAELEKRKAEYDEGVKQLENAKALTGSIGPIRWLSRPSWSNAGYVFAENQAKGLSSMSYAFSSLFLVIAALVIYATVGRMVQEQRALIGASKALGLYNREILDKYLFFGGSAAVTAVILGAGLTYFVVQERMLANYEPFFIFDSIPLCFRPVETAVVMLVLPLSAGISVWFACKSLIRIPAVKLLQGELPAQRRKASRRFSSRGLYTRLIFRNIRTDLRRVLVTIVSIAGCCQLLVGGFMIKHAIERVNERQFGQVIQFQAELRFDPDKADAARQFSHILDNCGLSYLSVGKHDFVIQNGDSLNSATAIVAEPSSLAGFYGLYEADTGEEIRPTDEGVLIPIRLSEYQEVCPGDSLAAYAAGLEAHEIPISGVFISHFGNTLFFTPDCYEKVFGTPAQQNCFLVRTDGMRLDELEARVQDIDGFRNLKDAATDRARLDRMSSVLNAMIFMLLGLAGVMAYFIVMNLSVTYIHQKTRELTIMRINGFTVRECVAYVSWDLVITTLAGILLGLVGGHFLGQMVLPVTEGPYMHFVHDPHPLTYVYAALITAGFSALISSAALMRIKNLKLSDLI